MSETVAAGQLRAFVERIERIEADIKEMNADKSEVYKELRGMGFDVKAVRQCVAARKLDSSELEERNAIFDMYWEALGGNRNLPDYEPRARAHVRENIEEISSWSATPVGPDGDPSTPSLEAGGAKMDGAANATPDRAAQAGTFHANSEQAVEQFEPPAFLVKATALRPLCLNPSECAGYGSHTCHRCLKAAGEERAA